MFGLHTLQPGLRAAEAPLVWTGGEGRRRLEREQGTARRGSNPPEDFFSDLTELRQRCIEYRTEPNPGANVQDQYR